MRDTNSTFAGNTASNGGGIFNNLATVRVTNTILAGSTGGNCTNTIQDGGHNIEDGTTYGFTGTNCSTTTGSSFCNTNPQLAAGLANNGGPTQTIALLAGSPAIDHGDPSVCAAPPVNDVDQRGFPRSTPADPICDIGAFEVQQARTGTSAPALSFRGLVALAFLLRALGCRALRRRAPGVACCCAVAFRLKLRHGPPLTPRKADGS